MGTDHSSPRIQFWRPHIDVHPGTEYIVFQFRNDYNLVVIKLPEAANQLADGFRHAHFLFQEMKF